MTNSPRTMPGAFNFHTNAPTNQVAPPRLSGAKSHLFQPPRETSVSASNSLILTKSTTSLMSLCSANTGSDTRNGGKLAPRKRTREDYNEPEELGGHLTPRNRYMTQGLGWGNSLVDQNQTENWSPNSPQPFVNTRYQLAGGMDTPSIAAARAVEAEDHIIYADAGYRKSLGDTERPIEMDIRAGMWGEDEDQSYFPNDLGHEGNGRTRFDIGPNVSPRPTDGWSKAALQVAGVVVGKVWEFCKNSGAVFSGFRAGGGTAYKIQHSDTARFTMMEDDPFWQEKSETTGRDSTPLPCEYPPENLDFIPDYIDRATPESTPPRPAKRRQVSYNSNTDELTKNWVVVPPTNPTALTPSKPKPKPHIRAPARYSMPTNASTGRRAAFNSTSRPASRASFVASVSSPRKPHLTSFASNPARLSHAGPPALSLNRGASYASPRGGASYASPRGSSPNSKIPRPTTPSQSQGSGSRHGATPSGSFGSQQQALQHGTDSPAAREAKRWAALKKKEEREADESIRRLDAQLKAMIREGKEALGTKVEVSIEDDEDVDTGFGGQTGGPKKWDF